eukprot:gene3883-5307_t
MNSVHIDAVDLNLLRLFDAVYRSRNVSRAAEALGLTQPGQEALSEPERFDPAASRKLFRIHMSDIGESRFLPELMASLQKQAPGVRVATRPVAHTALADALDSGVIDFAFGFLPQVKDTQRTEL